MISKLKFLYHQYPRQHWLMIRGIVISTAGGSMIWTFLLTSQRIILELDSPMKRGTLLYNWG